MGLCASVPGRSCALRSGLFVRLRALPRPGDAHNPHTPARSVLAGANNGVLQAEAKKYMDGLTEAARDAALEDARAFRVKHPAGSAGAMAAFDELSETRKSAVRILAGIAGGQHAATHAQRSATRSPPRALASSLRRPALVQATRVSSDIYIVPYIYDYLSTYL